jgi:hypothetical protein
LLEETGYAAGEMVFLAAGPMSSGASGEILTGFLAKGLEFRGIGERDEAEDIEVIKVPLPELDVKLLQFSKAGDFIDLKIYGLMALARGYLQSHTIPL